MTKTAEEQLPIKAFGWAAIDKSGVLSPFHFSRRDNGPDDVTVKIQYCGVCHSDLHTVKNEWGFTKYPVIPGHEMVGIVTKVGNNVTKFKQGDRVGVGVIVGSCKSCEQCKQDLENYCPRVIFTYNAPDMDGTRTQGGYADIIVVDQQFVLRFPDSLPSDSGAPLLCAGITVYSPMKYYGMTEAGKHLGVSGLGGLGHIAVKIAKAFGLKVTVISTSPSKEDEAIERLGADAFVVSHDPVKMKNDTAERVRGYDPDEIRFRAGPGFFKQAPVHLFNRSKMTLLRGYEYMTYDKNRFRVGPGFFKQPPVHPLWTYEHGPYLVFTNIWLLAAMGTMDFIIDTVSAVHPLGPLLGLLKVNGKLVTVGLPNKPLELPIFPLALGRKLVGGSDIGGMKETQEMLDFCAKHNISADVEVIKMDYINTALERLAKSDVRYRFVVDVASSFSAL